jgi:hypothetical protein
MCRAILVVMLMGLACSDSPIRPSSPPPSSPVQPVARLEIVPGDMVFTSFDQALGWTFTGRGRNVGDGCAGSVTGTVLFLSESGAELQTVGLGLGDRTVRPAEVFDFQACCLLAQHSKAAASAKVQFRWENRPCS